MVRSLPEHEVQQKREHLDHHQPHLCVRTAGIANLITPARAIRAKVDRLGAIE